MTNIILGRFQLTNSCQSVSASSPPCKESASRNDELANCCGGTGAAVCDAGCSCQPANGQLSRPSSTSRQHNSGKICSSTNGSTTGSGALSSLPHHHINVNELRLLQVCLTCFFLSFSHALVLL